VNQGSNKCQSEDFVRTAERNRSSFWLRLRRRQKSEAAGWPLHYHTGEVSLAMKAAREEAKERHREILTAPGSSTSEAGPSAGLVSETR